MYIKLLKIDVKIKVVETQYLDVYKTWKKKIMDIALLLKTVFQGMTNISKYKARHIYNI